VNLPSHMIGKLSAELRPATWQARFLEQCRNRSEAWERAQQTNRTTVGPTE